MLDFEHIQNALGRIKKSCVESKRYCAIGAAAVIVGAGLFFFGKPIGEGVYSFSQSISGAKEKSEQSEFEIRTSAHTFKVSISKTSGEYKLSSFPNNNEAIALFFAHNKSKPAIEMLETQAPKLSKKYKIVLLSDEELGIKGDYERAIIKKEVIAALKIRVLPTVILFNKQGSQNGLINGYKEIGE